MEKMNIRPMTSPRTGNAVANQYMITIGDFIYFQSYSTIIAKENTRTREVTLCKDWQYSRTTTKYLNEFLGTETKDIKARIDSGDYVVVETIELGA